ncbi:TonB-dependent receptor [Flexithrix dorotheae]|uniref:TonB-dependent receptor n=1 Tax=Flexithrix dorotheae TaxID=70993 RepID=UPI00035D0AE3|nr:TonB-dependent receptor [Flexithrix dorotheae]
MRKLLLQLFFMLAMCTAVYAQEATTIKGNVSDEDGPIIGANVILKGSTTGSVTDFEGNFMFKTEKSGNQTLIVSFVGFESLEKPINLSGGTVEVGTINLTPSAVGLAEVEVIASVAIDRKTPVAVTTIDSKFIEEKVGNQEFPEMLRYTPSVYVTKQGGGFGDSRINIRGFDQRNTAVMINGIPVNDMENGWVYWSNWAGLSDVTTKMQVQRGLGASKLAVPAIGGSINIITNAADMRKGGAASVSIGNDGYQKYGLVLSTGLGESGWALTLQGTHTTGNGYVAGTEFKGYSYFASLSKQIGNNHSIAITGLGAPQWHNQRDFAPRYKDYQKYKEFWGEEGHKYNSDWGYKNGEEYTWRRNFYHKPKIFVNWYWDVNDKTQIATSAYYSAGRGGGTGSRGGINGNADYRLPKTNDGLNRFDDIVSWNSGGTVADFGDNRLPWTGPDNRRGYFVGSNVATESSVDGEYRGDSYGLIRRASMNAHNWVGLISNVTHEINDRFNFVGGIDLRHYRGIHYRRVDNLLGNDAFYTNTNINIEGEFITQEKEAKALAEIKDDRKLNYHNDGLVKWVGFYGQLEYTGDQLSAFVSASASSQGFKRIEYFNNLYSDPNFETGWRDYWGGNIKGGVNYNLTENHNVFANAGYMERQPIFDNVYVNFGNNVNEDATNQKVIAYELGYGYRSSTFNANVNLYSTTWLDKQYSRSVQLGNQDGTANYTVDQKHEGIEVDFLWKPVRKLNITGMFSLGNWRYTTNTEAVVFDDDQQEIGKATLFLDDVKVGDAAQTTFSIGADYELLQGFRLTANYYQASKIYADFNPAEDDTFLEPGNQAWELPSYGLMDLGAYYTLKLKGTGSDLTFRLNVNNVLDEIYISESNSNILDSGAENIIPGTSNASINNNIYYGFGRTWNLGVKYRF